jgi:hypothetical protein
MWFHNALAMTHKKYQPRQKSGVFGDAKAFWTGMVEQHGDGWGDKPEANVDAAEKVRQILAGKSVAQVFAKKQPEGFAAPETPTPGAKFNPVDAYMSQAERVGPDMKLGDHDLAQKFIMLSSKMRGLQWGNAVTDSERAHHLTHAAHALKDLVDVLGLPEEMASVNGRLGLAVGARGHGRAMAHYEPSMRVINLTRKTGVGSLAHEWGHAFDNLMYGVLSGKYDNLERDKEPPHTEYISEKYHLLKLNPFRDEHVQKMGDTMKKIIDRLQSEVRPRMNEDVTKSGVKLNRNWRDYWFQNKEMFSRAFEKYVDHKLKQKGQKNTYLTGVSPHPLWPTGAETEQLAPLFDQLFAHFRASPHLKKSLPAQVLAKNADKRKWGR